MEKSLEFMRDMFPIDKEIIYQTFLASNKDVDETISKLIVICNKDVRNPPSYEEATSANHNANCLELDAPEISKKRKDSRRNLGKKDWKPVILGKLPDDFLRVSNEIVNNSASRGFLCKGCAKLLQRGSIDYSVISSPSSQLQSPSLKLSEFENIDTIIRRRMENNVSLTRNVTMDGEPDPDNIQYLDDERLALMLQNQEFLKLVRSDPEFQQALKEDQQSVVSCTTSGTVARNHDNDSDEGSDIWKERVGRDSLFPSHEMGEEYGYQQSDIADPDHLWPDHPTPSNNDIGRICKAMGKASRKQLNSLAKRFMSIRRRRTPRNYLHFDDIDPSTSSGQQTHHSRWETESTQNLIPTELDNDDWLDTETNRSVSVVSHHSDRSRTGTLI